MNKNNLKFDSIKFVRSLPSDNPSPEAKVWVQQKIQDYKDGLMTEVEYQKQILGNFDYADDAASLISYEAIMDYWNPKHFKGVGHNYLTIDVARKGKDKTVFRVWHGWLVIARFEMARSLVTEVVEKAEQIMEKFQIRKSNTIADEDGVGGGVVDVLGCQGFVNNSTALHGENYVNLKTQCSYKMSEKITKREAGENCSVATIIRQTTEEMEQVMLKDIDKDGKIALVPKDEVKENIGRSPDDWDSIMMRYYFELVGTLGLINIE